MEDGFSEHLSSNIMVGTHVFVFYTYLNIWSARCVDDNEIRIKCY